MGEATHHRIRALEVTGGFLEGLHLEFTDGLNCIIGGRGTGKTTALEFVRYALGLVPDQRQNAPLARRVGKLVQGNLGAGRIRLEVETKHGIHYTVVRPMGDSPQVFDEKDQPLVISLDRDSIFKVDVYSQSEIEEIATSPKFQLVLIDKFIDERIRKIRAEILAVVRQLRENSGELRTLRSRATELANIASESPVLEEKLKALQIPEGPDADLINRAHAQKSLRSKEAKTVESILLDVSNGEKQITTAINSLTSHLSTRIDKDIAQGPNQALFARIATITDKFAVSLNHTATLLAQLASDTSKQLAVEQKHLRGFHAKQEAAYRGFVAESEEEQGRAMERIKLQERFVEVSTAQQELEAAHTDIQAIEKRRLALTSNLSSLRDERFALRKSVANKLTSDLGPFIRVSMSQGGERSEYRTLLLAALKGRGMRYKAIVERLVLNIAPEELARLVDQGRPERLAEQAGVAEDRAIKVIDALRGEARYQLDVVELEDSPRVELLDGNVYKDSGDLSTGQRCTTILPILLLESDRPLLVDQPEDNLDNAFIYDTIVQRLKSVKRTRQLIFVTHNPNIPVLGDAEQVFVLKSDGKQGTLSQAGNVDEVKTHIETLLEGGREAFLSRKARYGY